MNRLPDSQVPNQDLAEENRMLHGLLQTVGRDAAHNHQVMVRFQERELTLLNAQDLADLLTHLTTGVRASFGLDEVRLVLLDPYRVIADLLDSTAAGGPPSEVELARDIPATLARFPDRHAPALGAWDPEVHLGAFGRRLGGSVALLPLRQPDGLAGFLCLQSRDPQRFQTGYQTDFLGHLARIAAVCLENAVNRERLRLVGLTDSLTGLYNRRHLEHRLTQEITRARRYRQTLSCLFIDADHFKQINDRHGHPAGDQVLVALAQRLRSRLRSSDLPTRYGGEEFAVLLPQTDGASARRLAQQICDEIAAEPVVLDSGMAIEVTVSIGVASTEDYIGPPSDVAAALLQAADDAVYRAKAAGRNRIAGDRG